MPVSWFPTPLFALTHRQGFADVVSCPQLERWEQAGRFSSLAFALCHITLSARNALGERRPAYEFPLCPHPEGYVLLDSLHGIGAVGGALSCCWTSAAIPWALDAMLPGFQVLPLVEILFQDFTFSGWALLTVNGPTNLTAALLLRHPLADILGGVFSVTLMLWIGIRFPLNFMSAACFVFGQLQAITGYMAWIFRRQESFRVSEADPNLGRDPKHFVVCFSRVDYTKKTALEEADRPVACFRQLRLGSEQRGPGGAAASGCAAGPCQWRIPVWTSGSSTA